MTKYLSCVLGIFKYDPHPSPAKSQPIIVRAGVSIHSLESDILAIGRGR